MPQSPAASTRARSDRAEARRPGNQSSVECWPPCYGWLGLQSSSCDLSAFRLPRHCRCIVPDGAGCGKLGPECHDQYTGAVGEPVQPTLPGSGTAVGIGHLRSVALLQRSRGTSGQRGDRPQTAELTRPGSSGGLVSLPDGVLLLRIGAASARAQWWLGRGEKSVTRATAGLALALPTSA